MNSREKHFHFARGVLYSIGLAALVAGAGCGADTSGSFDGVGGRGSERGVSDSASEVDAAVPWGKGEDCRPWGCAEKASERQSALPASSPALACSSPAQCVSGFCVDGVCCDSACTGSCEACSASKKGQGADGTCGAIALYADPDNECDDGACDGSGSCKKYNGATCGTTTECLSGNCADGFCCGAPCNETCRACSIAKRGGGFDGQCGPIAAGTDPDNECDSGECNGAAACTLPKPLANGVACIESSQCTSGNCVDGVCCDTACSGTCQACTAVKKGQGADGTCGPIAANQDPDDECLDGVCTGAETCIKFNGATCSSPDECLSGYCADGYCCGAACTESCLACSADKKGGGVNGQCGPIAAGTDPDNECAGGECNGAAACAFVSGATCIDGIKNGNETDVDCGGGICATCGIGKTCNVAADCATNQCLGGTCVVVESGCSDGQREGYIGSPNIAACSGGWSIPGVTTVAGPSCNHDAGDDSANPAGTGCSVADLCEVGWHVCINSLDVASRSGGLNCNGNFSNPSNTSDMRLFFATRQSGPGIGLCGNGNDDLFGCGTIGNTPDASCGVLNRFSNNFCVSLGNPWLCGNIAWGEAANVTKNGSTRGGVLCCRDTNLPVNLANGVACIESSQCTSNNCVDGVCCDTACSGTCTACNVPGSVGACSNVPAGQQDADSCSGSIQSCDGNGSCNACTSTTLSFVDDCTVPWDLHEIEYKGSNNAGNSSVSASLLPGYIRLRLDYGNVPPLPESGVTGYWNSTLTYTPQSTNESIQLSFSVKLKGDGKSPVVTYSQHIYFYALQDGVKKVFPLQPIWVTSNWQTFTLTGQPHTLSSGSPVKFGIGYGGGTGDSASYDSLYQTFGVDDFAVAIQTICP